MSVIAYLGQIFSIGSSSESLPRLARIAILMAVNCFETEPISKIVSTVLGR